MSWLTGNWHLKLGALLVSVLLYTGLVYSGSFTEQTQDGIPIRAVNQPLDTYLLSGLLGSAQVTYRSSSDASGRVSAGTFSASVDLSAYDLEQAAEPQLLPVTIRSLDEAVEVLEAAPLRVSVALDRLGTRQVPIVVDRGDVPPGLVLGTPSVVPTTAQARGPESRLRLVVRAVARVRIDPSGIDVSQQVDLVPVDATGARVDAVDLAPESATVRIEVATAQTSKTVPVVPLVTGAPGIGFVLTSLSVQPAVVTLIGTADALAGITSVSTEPIDLDGATTDGTFSAALVLPAGASLAAGAVDQATVAVNIDPERVTRTFLVGPTCQGADSGLACLPQAEQVAVTVSGTRTAVSALTAQQIGAVVDVSGLAVGTYQLVPSVSLPAGISLVQPLGAITVVVASA